MPASQSACMKQESNLQDKVLQWQWKHSSPGLLVKPPPERTSIILFLIVSKKVHQVSQVSPVVGQRMNRTDKLVKDSQSVICNCASVGIYQESAFGESQKGSLLSSHSPCPHFWTHQCRTANWEKIMTSLIYSVKILFLSIQGTPPPGPFRWPRRKEHQHPGKLFGDVWCSKICYNIRFKDLRISAISTWTSFIGLHLFCRYICSSWFGVTISMFMISDQGDIGCSTCWLNACWTPIERYGTTSVYT